MQEEFINCIDTTYFKEKLLKVYGENYNLNRISISNKNEYIIINCDKHGKSERSIRKLFEGYECSQCRLEQQRLKKQEIFIEKSNIKFNKKFDYTKVNFINTNTKVYIVCPVHGVFETTPKEHLRSVHGCPKCSFMSTQQALSSNTDTFIRRAKEIHGNRYDYSLVHYVNTLTKVKIICKEHGIFEQSPATHLKGTNCPVCGQNMSHASQTSNTAEFIQKAQIVHGNKYDYSKVNYINSTSKVIIACKKHGDFLQTPHKHLCGKGCPFCNESKGEKSIRNWLIKNNIEFEGQKRFSDLRDKKLLSYDFYIPSKNMLIEYNGQQHYSENEIFGGKDYFVIQNKHDIMKNEYAIAHNFNLLVIPYWNFVNIDSILEKEIINDGK